jgi:hypothetical protein
MRVYAGIFCQRTPYANLSCHRIKRNSISDHGTLELLYLGRHLEMENSQPDKTTSVLSTELIIEHLKSIRDNTLNILLKNDDALMAFLEKHFDTIAISPVKREFLKRDLVELKNSSLDLVHYSSLIKETKEKGGMMITEEHHLFSQELRVICEKYGF